MTVNQHMMGFISDQLKVRMNNPSYIIKAEDKLIGLFGRGEKDLREFVNLFNLETEFFPGEVDKLKYSKNLTYKKVLISFIKNYEQIKSTKIHKDSEC